VEAVTFVCVFSRGQWSLSAAFLRLLIGGERKGWEVGGKGRRPLESPPKGSKLDG
jgi:hypothetical protein